MSRLPGFLRRPVGTIEARRERRRRLDGRGEDFLTFLKRSVYGRNKSPYLSLFTHAGVEPGDIESLVRRDGLEGALRALFQAGVYLTSEELKGRQPVRQGSLTLAVDQQSLRNPAASVHMLLHTSGRTGRKRVVGLDLAQVRYEAVDLRLF